MGEQHALSMGSMGLGTGITNEVLAVVSHDLRNPLSIISVGASLLDGGQHSERERAEILRVIKNASDRMAPKWRDRYLAASVFNLKGSGDKDNDLVKRTRAALSG